MLRYEHARHMADMQAKLAWYVENHELLKSNEELVRQQASTIVQLENQLLSPARPTTREHDRLLELQRENDSLKVSCECSYRLLVSVLWAMGAALAIKELTMPNTSQF